VDFLQKDQSEACKAFLSLSASFSVPPMFAKRQKDTVVQKEENRDGAMQHGKG